MVLIAIAILTTLVVDLIYFTQVDNEISANTRDEIIARYIAKSGVQVVAGTINNRPLEEIKEITGLFGDQTGYSEGYWAVNVPSFPVGNGTVSITVIDERSKINLNALVSQTTNQVDQQVLMEDARAMFEAIGSKDKELVVFDGENGGAAHTQFDNHLPALQVCADWVTKKL